MSVPRLLRWPAREILAVTVAVLIVAAGELAARRLLPDASSPKRPPGLRAGNVHVVPGYGLSLPEGAPEKPLVFLVGNSHTYALPGPRKGSGLIFDPGITLIDRVASSVAEESGAQASFYRLAYPNFLPFEMLLRTSYLLSKGWEPAVVVLGVTYRNMVHDTEPRHDVKVVLRDAAFRNELSAMLGTEGVAGSAPSVLAAIRRQEEQSDREEREERMRSDADRLEAALVESLGARLTLLGRSDDVRSAIYRWLTFDLQSRFVNRKVGYLYDHVESDYAFNRECLWVYLRMLRARGVAVLVYLAPERGDLPPMVDPARQAEFNRDLRALLDGLGMPLLDARTLVPDDQWGWMLDTPDRSHFSEKGHESLGRFLAVEGRRFGVWEALERGR